MTAAARVVVAVACAIEMMMIVRFTGLPPITILTGVLALQIIFTIVQQLFLLG
jgi:hypothetical protein